MTKTSIWIRMAIAMVLSLPTFVFAAKAPDDARRKEIMDKSYRISVPFIENNGQINNESVQFYTKTLGGTLFVEQNGVLTYSLPYEDKGRIVIKEVFTDKKITVKGLDFSPTKANYFKGNDKNKWKSNIPSYGSVSVGEIYKGIDLKLKAYGNNVEKLFTVLPESSPERIKVKLEGDKGLRVNDAGELEVLTELGTVRFTKPIAYQEAAGVRKTVEVSYAIQKGSSYGFKVGDYDNKMPLIIDPLLASTFIGGSESDFQTSYMDDNILGIDEGGNVYITGRTLSSDYPVTPGAYDTSFDGSVIAGAGDAFIAKFDSNLTSLLACTFIGGNYADTSYSLALDSEGNAYITGLTSSSDFPTTPGAYDTTYNGGGVFLAKLDSSLTTLLASTFIGGGNTISSSLSIDAGGNVFVTGQTCSSAFPTTLGAYDTTYAYCDIFVSKLNGSLSGLLASTFIGGSNLEHAYSLSIDAVGNIFVTGDTDSSDYPTTPDAYDISHNGGEDIIVSKFDNSLSNLLASTFIGGSKDISWVEMADSLSIDITGNVFITGRTDSANYPTTPGAYDESFNNEGGSCAFVSKFNSSLSNLLASTFVGGSSAGKSLVLDGDGNVYITGYTGSSVFPTTPGAFDISCSGDAFVSKLDNDLSSLLASTCIGGWVGESSNSLAFDGNGNVYITGYTSSSDYPITPSAYDVKYNGGYTDIFISKFDNIFSFIDPDGDGVSDNVDNCPDTPNGPDVGTCTTGDAFKIARPCDLDDDCGPAGFCSKNQEDEDEDGIGDACEFCEGDFQCDLDVDGLDAATFKADFGRSIFHNPCGNENLCHGDFDCDHDADGTDAARFKKDFGRSPVHPNPCPPCAVGIWCVYP